MEKLWKFTPENGIKKGNKKEKRRRKTCLMFESGDFPEIFYGIRGIDNVL